MDKHLSRYPALPSAMLLLVAAIWGSGFTASQMALDAGVSPELLMLVRFTIAALIILITCFGRLRRVMTRSQLRGGLIVGLFLFLAFYLQIIALQFTTPSNNAFLTGTNVVMVPFIWWAVSKKRPDRRIFFSSALCLLGVGVLSVKLSQGFAFSAGDMLTLAGAFFFACQIAATGYFGRSMDSVLLVFLQFSVAAVLSLLVFVLSDGSFAALGSRNGIVSVVYLGVFSTCLCYFMQTVGQRYVSSSRAAILLAAESLFGTLFSVLLGYEPMTLPMVVGGAIIVISLVLTEAGGEAS